MIFFGHSISQCDTPGHKTCSHSLWGNLVALHEKQRAGNCKTIQDQGDCAVLEDSHVGSA